MLWLKFRVSKRLHQPLLPGCLLLSCQPVLQHATRIHRLSHSNVVQRRWMLLSKGQQRGKCCLVAGTGPPLLQLGHLVGGLAEVEGVALPPCMLHQLHHLLARLGSLDQLRQSWATNSAARLWLPLLLRLGAGALEQLLLQGDTARHSSQYRI